MCNILWMQRKIPTNGRVHAFFLYIENKINAFVLQRDSYWHSPAHFIFDAHQSQWHVTGQGWQIYTPQNKALLVCDHMFVGPLSSKHFIECGGRPHDTALRGVRVEEKQVDFGCCNVLWRGGTNFRVLVFFSRGEVGRGRLSLLCSKYSVWHGRETTLLVDRYLVQTEAGFLVSTVAFIVIFRREEWRRTYALSLNPFNAVFNLPRKECPTILWQCGLYIAARLTS